MAISPSAPITATAGETVTLRCSADITPQLQGVSSPEFEWLFGTTNVPLSSSINTHSGNTYISTLHIPMVRVSDEGRYTCRLRGNQRTAVSTTITVNGIHACMHVVQCHTFMLVRDSRRLGTKFNVEGIYSIAKNNTETKRAYIYSV